MPSVHVPQCFDQLVFAVFVSHIATVNAGERVCGSIRTFISRVPGFNTVNVPQANDFHQESVLPHGHLGPYKYLADTQ